MDSYLRREFLLYALLCCMIVARYSVKHWKRTVIVRCGVLEERVQASVQQYRALTERYDRLVQPSRLKRALKEIEKRRSEQKNDTKNDTKKHDSKK